MNTQRVRKHERRFLEDNNSWQHAIIGSAVYVANPVDEASKISRSISHSWKTPQTLLQVEDWSLLSSKVDRTDYARVISHDLNQPLAVGGAPSFPGASKNVQLMREFLAKVRVQFGTEYLLSDILGNQCCQLCFQLKKRVQHYIQRVFNFCGLLSVAGGLSTSCPGAIPIVFLSPTSHPNYIKPNSRCKVT